jgi:hypothetical protein
MLKKTILLLIIAITLSNAATIKGIVFDTNLEPIKAIVSLNTTPLQTIVSQNGSFAFQVQNGVYALTAKAENHSVSETIRVVEDGVFNVDLILFGFDDPSLEIPNVSEGTGFEGQRTGIENETLTAQPQFPWEFAAVMAGAIAVLALVFLKWKSLSKRAKYETAEKKREGKPSNPKTGLKGLNEFQEKIIDEIRKNEGRISQRELRKRLPWSEAKVSIELDLLEERGLIKKFKKGRGNMVILVGK